MKPLHTFHLVGDTQRTHWTERLLGRESNPGVPARIFQEIASDRGECLFIVGDLVTVGSSRREWAYFDEVFQVVRELKLPTYALWGNHDYFWNQRRARCEMESRFPHLRKESWGRVNFGPLEVIFLDTNRSALGGRWDLQIQFLNDCLLDIEKSEKIRAAVVMGHHPAITQASGMHGSRAVLDHVVPSLEKSPKTLAYLSGHAHVFENTFWKGKQFIVSGGGGGPRRRLNGQFSPFHYLRFDVYGDRTLITARGFRDSDPTSDFSKIELKY